VPPRQPDPHGYSRDQIRSQVQSIVAHQDYQLLVDRAREWGEQLASRKLPMTQIRRVFGEVKRLQMRWEPHRLRMLQPRLAYVGARAKDHGGPLLRDILTPAIEMVFQASGDDQRKSRFRVLSDLFEAILAHYTEHERGQGGRDR
jgi:CRISPR-associated protein Csm2